MADIDPESTKSQEEPLLAEYLVTSVCARASGAYESECTYGAPKDRYFLGSLRPVPLEGEAGPRGRPAFFAELLNKLAPVAFGAEFKLRPDSNELTARVRLQWNCYYRVFPTLQEQRDYQRHGALSGEDDDAGHDEMVDLFAGVDEPWESKGADGEVPAARPRRPPQDRSTDVLFPKYRKIACNATGLVAANRSRSGWVVDLADFVAALRTEVGRAQTVVAHDVERLRVGTDPEAKVRVPAGALESPSAYQAFTQGLTTELLPKWEWTPSVQVRVEDEGGTIIMAFEATNTSAIDDRSWCEEGYLFDVRASFVFDDGEVVPFQLEVSPRGFRYDRHLWGNGFNCSVARAGAADSPFAFVTTNVPVFSQPRYSTNVHPPAAFSDLAADPIPHLQKIRDAMRVYRSEWTRRRQAYVASDPTWEEKHGTEYDEDAATFSSEVARFERGCELIETVADLRTAFQLTNQAFAAGGQKTAWRLFQIVFLVAQIPGIHALESPEPKDIEDRAIVDIVYFPTGGGKTEAYLGVIVFHCFYDRLRGKQAGVTAWTRFPLRLLTLQQTQRVADVIGSAELVRRDHADARLSGSGVDGFGVGYFVGMEATPNELTPPRQGEAEPNWSIANDPVARQNWKKIVRCPSCKTTNVTVDFDAASVRVLHRCQEKRCRFPGGVLPILIIDNEIFRYLPSVVVGTIDKLAGLGNQRKQSLVLGQVTGRCSVHGYYSRKCCQKECTDQRRWRAGAPMGITGPTLFVQDELHLLKEGLGTFDGHYETFLQALLKHFDGPPGPKIIASSATIEAFDRQVSHLYGRAARVFPGHGPTLDASFYAQTFSYPQRLYVGILPHNKTIFNAALELLGYYHEEVDKLVRRASGEVNPFGGRVAPGTPEWDALLDPYVTSLSYFSSTREMSSIRTDLESHVNTELERSGHPALRIAELSGSTSTDAVTRTLTLLEGAKPSGTEAPSAILATSMISHGVDVDRFNFMLFYGMPRQNAEYIQASSRVGRSHVGIVFAALKPARERDQSHFTYFVKYHEFLGRLVEPVAINRWSKFSISRTLPGLFMGVLLQLLANESSEENPNRYYMVGFVKRLISEGSLSAGDFVGVLEKAFLVDQVTGPGPDAFRAEISTRVRQFMDQILGAGGQSTFVSSAILPSPMRSLRDVDEQIPIELDSNGSAWAARTGT